MAKYKAYFTTTASATVEFEIDDAVIGSDDDNDDAISDAAFNAISDLYLCAQCSGWGREYSLELGEFEPDDCIPVKNDSDVNYERIDE